MLRCFHMVFYHTCVLLQGTHHTMVYYCGVVSHGLHAVSFLFFFFNCRAIYECCVLYINLISLKKRKNMEAFIT